MSTPDDDHQAAWEAFVAALASGDLARQSAAWATYQTFWWRRIGRHFLPRDNSKETAHD